MSRLLYLTSQASSRGELSPFPPLETKNVYQNKPARARRLDTDRQYNIIMYRKPSTEDTEKASYKAVKEIIAGLKAAGKPVFAVPMWKFNIHYVLKHYLDVTCQPYYTFAAGPESYTDLCAAKAFIAYYRGVGFPAKGSALGITATF